MLTNEKQKHIFLFNVFETSLLCSKMYLIRKYRKTVILQISIVWSKTIDYLKSTLLQNYTKVLLR